MNTLHRREPGQNSQATHDRVYALSDLQVREAAAQTRARGKTPTPRSVYASRSSS
ncbi:hypothetical protein [Streptomyces sp. NPDC090798]|uniref:hypothetical protein n=1 Tax=Streptomyces sp. NPDC090798 TaxID=3365968 RepID=UPI0037F80D5A